MEEVPQTNLLNPAVQIPCKLYVGLPVLGSIQANYSNTAFTYQDLAGGSTWNLERVYDQMHRRDLLSAQVQIALLSLGYKHGPNYFTFNMVERAQVFPTIPRDAATLAVYGNGSFIGDRAKLSGLRPGALHVREHSLGWSRVLGPYLTAGVRAKLLFGKASASTGKTKVNLETAEDNFAMDLETDYTLLTSFPYTLQLDEEGNIAGAELDDIDPATYLLNRQNPGFAVDLGLQYSYSEKLRFSASVLDLGFLRWRSDVYRIRARGTYSNVGLDLNADFGTPEFIQEAVDTLLSYIDVNVLEEPYTATLPAQVFLGASYQHSDKIRFGALNRNVFFRSKWHASFTLSATGSLAGRFLGTLSWSYLNNSLANVGVGLVYHGKGLQFHAVTDNLLAAFYPFNTRTMNFRMGVNLLLGCPRERRGKMAMEGRSRIRAGGDCPSMEDPRKVRRKREKAARRLNR